MRKDVGVVIVVLIALALGLLLRAQSANRATIFQDKQTAFSLAYPATWGNVESLQDVLLKVEDPQTNSAFKTTLAVETRDLDPTSPPTLQQLVDRRIAQRGALTGYHFLTSHPATVGGAKAMRQEYAYIVQPIDQPRSASLPVVVHSVEYIVVGKENVFYITLSAPESDFADARAQMEQIVQTVKVQ
ncbi:MAG: DUF1795 domain-containing protein [Anaerolineales bacterium]|nr:DUF1795 domain-containing protein [Anaerolineales bacterium]